MPKLGAGRGDKFTLLTHVCHLVMFFLNVPLERIFAGGAVAALFTREWPLTCIRKAEIKDFIDCNGCCVSNLNMTIPRVKRQRFESILMSLVRFFSIDHHIGALPEVVDVCWFYVILSSILLNALTSYKFIRSYES